MVYYNMKQTKMFLEMIFCWMRYKKFQINQINITICVFYILHAFENVEGETELSPF